MSPRFLPSPRSFVTPGVLELLLKPTESEVT